MVVYLEGVMLMNFLIDFLLLLATNRLCGYSTVLWRVLLAAALGGVYAGCCLLPDFSFLSNIVWCVVVLILIAWLAFGWGKTTVRRVAVFVLLSMSLGGLAIGVQGGGVYAVILSGVALYLMCHIGFGRKIIGTQYIPVDIQYGGKHLHLTALADTGNTLRDPLSGKPVLIIGARCAQELTGLNESQLQDPVGTVADAPIEGLRLIPYRSVGNGGDFMLGMKIKEVSIGKETGSTLVGLAAYNLDSRGMYQALTGGNV